MKTDLAKSLPTISQAAERIFVALDMADADAAMALASRLAPLGIGFKVGMELFYAPKGGSDVIARLKALDRPIFLDLKLHDIPNTVSRSLKALSRLGVDFINVHAQGGVEMMQAAAEAVHAAKHAPKLLAVTLLTSLDESQLREFLGVEGLSLPEYVEHLARQAHACGLDGVVCSAREAAALRKACGEDFLLVTPGIRPATQVSAGETGRDGDQARIVEPCQAIRNGADFLVIGRPVTQAADPVAMCGMILNDLQKAFC